MLPGYQNLTTDQKLDRALSLPGMRGIVRGATASPTVHAVPEKGFPSGEIVTDYPFRVRGFIGSLPSPFAIGATISLRVPGGSIAGVTSTEEGSPLVAPGEELYVFVRDQGSIAGGNTSAILVASSTYDVFEVRNGIVHGEGDWARFSETRSAFERHFVH